ncbi:MAG TPA: tetratricopeptide repeat protein [Candidatus Eremiobacteraceae bacterium]|nr:tetratricopeptide repeat protein [Candidatus Eremiobacteraceae bacterium]
MDSRHYSWLWLRRCALVIALGTATLLSEAVAQTRQQTVEEAKARAEQGDPTAQYEYGHFQLVHNATPEGIASGLKFLRASAAQNYAKAEFYLGWLYEHGGPVRVDYTLALENYKAAAAQHNGAAENNLASMYEKGQGVRKNLKTAWQWYLAGAQDGDAWAQANLASIYYKGRGTKRNYEETVRWLRASANNGLPEGENNLAYFYFYGIGVATDYNEAARLLRAAAENLPAAQTNLAYLYEQGKGVPLDYVAAHTWYSRAIAAGDTTGSERLKQLEQIMTQKQLDEARGVMTAKTREATKGLAQGGAFSLVGH